MARRQFAGLEVEVESPAGSTRHWRDRAAGREGSTLMRHDYGYLVGHAGSDGEDVDCYLGPDEGAGFVYVVHQRRAPEYAAHDEDKVMLGFASEAAAKAAYLAHRDDGERAYGGMSAVPVDRFLAKLQRRTGDGKIRHEATMAEPFVEMRVEQRGSQWVVLPESGDRVLGTHKTKADAEAQLRAIEASKTRAAEQTHVEMGNRDVNGITLRVGDAVEPVVGGRRGVITQVTTIDVIVRWDDGRREDRGADALRKINSSPVAEHEAERAAALEIGTPHQRALAAAGMSPRIRCAMFDASRGPDGKVRMGVWDYVCVEGRDEKDGQETEFSPETLGQMVRNFARRGDPVPIDHNHQSNYAAQNGKPAPALGFYGALAIVWGGRVVDSASLPGVQPTTEGLDLSRNGLWAYRSEVTELGDELLPNFKFLSPTFTPRGVTREGDQTGYSLAAVAATNTPWQSGTKITFTAPPGAPTQGDRPMAQKLAAFAKKYLKMEGDPSDDEAKKALAKKMDDEGSAALEADEAYDYGGRAAALEDMARSYEDAHMDDEAGEEPHVVMRKMAAKFRKLGKMGDPPFGGKETPSEEKAEEKAKMEDEAKKMAAAAFAARLGIKLDGGLTGAQMMDAIGAASLPASDVPKIVEAQVTQALARRDAERAKADTAGKAKELVAMAIDGGYPREREAELLRAASDPALYATMEVAVRPYVDAARGRDPQLFDQLTFAGAPRGAGAGPRATASASGPDVKVVRNELATFVEIGGRFSKMACDMADSNDPATRAKIDAVLSDSERSHPGLRLIAANRILEKERPDLLETEQRSELQLMGLF